MSRVEGESRPMELGDAGAWSDGLQRLPAWVNNRATTAIVGVAVFAAGLSCYPLVFFGKSFVSPNNSGATTLLYDLFPPSGIPECLRRKRQRVRYGRHNVADPSLFGDSEPSALQRLRVLPLRNRYNSSGTTLLGQGQSMFGDPLHAMVLFAGGRPELGISSTCSRKYCSRPARA